LYRRRIDPDFPSEKTVWGHFRRAEMLERLRKWISDKDDFADLAAMLPTKEIMPEPSKRVAASQEGLVYLLRSGAHFKIGRSDELERRVKEITVAIPEAVTLVHAIRTDDPAGIEAYWHRRFADRRANGEWFKLTPGDITAFKRRKFQ
jgi:FAD/FMN-containing dehydrogenase